MYAQAKTETILRVGGWSGHPYQPDSTNDRQATAIAKQFLPLFTQVMRRNGLMPFTGVEVNAVCEDDNTSYIKNPEIRKFDAQNSRINDVIPHFLNAMAADSSLMSEEEEYPILEENETFVSIFDDILKPLSERLLVSSAAYQMKYDDAVQNAVQTIKQYNSAVATKAVNIALGEINHLRERFKEIRKNQDFYREVYLSRDNTGDYFPINPEIIEAVNEIHSKKCEVTERNIQAIKETVARANETTPAHPFSPSGDINGRVYSDAGELEMATPAFSPEDTVDCVNGYKQILFEATDAFEEMKGVQTEQQARDIERHPLSLAIRNYIHDISGPFDISFADEHSVSGEHIAISFQHDPEQSKTYETAKEETFETEEGGHRLCFGRDNVMQHLMWRKLFEEAFEHYLPREELLAASNRKLFAYNKENHVHFIKQNHDSFNEESAPSIQLNSPRQSRLEIRTFNYAGSNIALTMLAISAISCAVIKEIAANTELSERLKQDPSSLTEADVTSVLVSLSQKYRPDNSLPADYQEASERFRRNSVTLGMMHELVDDMMPEEERAEGHKQVHRFRDLVENRAKEVMEDVGAAVGLG